MDCGAPIHGQCILDFSQTFYFIPIDTNISPHQAVLNIRAEFFEKEFARLLLPQEMQAHQAKFDQTLAHVLKKRNILKAYDKIF